MTLIIEEELTTAEDQQLSNVLQRMLRSDHYVSWRAGYLTIDASIRISPAESRAIERARKIPPR